MLTREEQLRTEAKDLYLQAKTSDDNQKQLSLYTDAIGKLNDLGEALTDDDRLLIARCQNNIALSYDHSDEGKLSIEGYQKAITLWKNIKNPTEEHYTYVVHMYLNLCHRFAEYAIKRNNAAYKPQATEYAETALDELEELLVKPGREQPDNELRLFGKLHFLLGMCGTDKDCNANDEYHSAKRFLSKIQVKKTDAFEDVDLLAMCNHNIGIIHLECGMPDAAVPYFNDALKYYSEVKTSAAAQNSEEITNILDKIKNSERNYVLAPLPRQFSI